jgi:aspartyl-tRNA(Asn)/glutamyl-tRNA(Gln) amidotransferase subunit B
VEAGHRIEAWTLEWDEDTNTLKKMRSKETEADYRYFREPDLLPIHLSDEWKASILADLPELPLERTARFITQYNLPAYDSDILTSERSLSDYFEDALKAYAGQSPTGEHATWVPAREARLQLVDERRLAFT